MALDCSPDHHDSVKDIIDAVRQVYIGIVVPQTISVPPPEDVNSRRVCFEIAMTLLKALQENDKKMNQVEADKLFASKLKLNLIRANIESFNKT